MLKYSLPLVPNSLSWTIINFSDRFVVSSVLGTSVNGVYSMAYKFPNLVDTVYSFFYTAWKESAARSSKDNDATAFYNTVYSILRNLMRAVILMMISVLPFVFSLLVKKGFQKAYGYIPVLVLSMYFSNMSGFYGGIFSAYKDTSIMGKTTIIGAILNLVVDLCLIKSVGVWAAAVSTIISSLVVYIYRRFAIRKYVALSDNYIEICLYFLVVGNAVYCYYSDILLVRILGFLVSFVYCVYNNKVLIYSMFDYIKSMIDAGKKGNTVTNDHNNY